MTSDDFETGWKLFCQGEFWEAHEAWELEWRRSKANRKTLFQIWIQSSALALKLNSPHLSAADRIRKRVLELSQSLTESEWRLCGISKEAFMELMATWSGDPEELLRLRKP